MIGLIAVMVIIVGVFLLHTLPSILKSRNVRFERVAELELQRSVNERETAKYNLHAAECEAQARKNLEQ